MRSLTAMNTDERPVAFLDANVLRGMLTTDTLLTMADWDLFEVKWSTYVLDEVLRNGPSLLDIEKLDMRLRQMNIAFPKALADDYGHLVNRMPADPKDRPVLAAAVACGAHVLVTENLADFWPESLPRTPPCVFLPVIS